MGNDRLLVWLLLSTLTAETKATPIIHHSGQWKHWNDEVTKLSMNHNSFKRAIIYKDYRRCYYRLTIRLIVSSVDVEGRLKEKTGKMRRAKMLSGLEKEQGIFSAKGALMRSVNTIESTGESRIPDEGPVRGVPRICAEAWIPRSHAQYSSFHSLFRQYFPLYFPLAAIPELWQKSPTSGWSSRKPLKWWDGRFSCCIYRWRQRKSIEIFI